MIRFNSKRGSKPGIAGCRRFSAQPWRRESTTTTTRESGLKAPLVMTPALLARVRAMIASKI